MARRVNVDLLTDAERIRLDNCRDTQFAKRAKNRAEGACINENKLGTHGPATHGTRCHRCYLVHKKGRRIAEVQLGAETT